MCLFVSALFQTDKASILDEAIEYLKSLQMQVQVGQFKNNNFVHIHLMFFRMKVFILLRIYTEIIVNRQIMWMGSGMPPMMYPGMNPLMACMGPVNPANMPQMQGLVQMPRVPFINPSLATLNPVPNHLPQFVGPTLNPTSNFHAQMQGIHIAQQRGQQAAQVRRTSRFLQKL